METKQISPVSDIYTFSAKEYRWAFARSQVDRIREGPSQGLLLQGLRPLPQSIERREFGFGDFERKIAYRHMAFRDWKALKTYLTNDAPPFVSVSSAHYQHPDGRPMENKGRIGAELVFDLDANDLNLPCAKVHGSSWVCDKCLDAVKAETHKLIEDFLMSDFGFSERR
jgi:DNA primase small subunit